MGTFAGSSPATGSPRCDVGVLVVHGIGQQRAGDTLLAFGEPIVQALKEHCRLRGGGLDDVSVDRVVLSGDADQPAHALVKVALERGPNASPQSWLLAESFWADSFQPPRYGALLSWLLADGPWVVVLHIAAMAGRAKAWIDWAERSAERYGEDLRNGVLPFKFVKVLPLVIKPFFLMFTLPFWAFSTASFGILALLTTAIIPVLNIVPLEAVRRAVQRVQRTILTTLGDSFLLVSSPLQEAAMRTQVNRNIDWLSKRCRAFVVLAHSQGATVTYLALKARPTPLVGFQTLVTFGAGTRKLAGVVDYQRSQSRGQRRLLSAAVCLATTGIWTSFLWAPAMGGGPSWLPWLLSVPGLLVLSLVSVGAYTFLSDEMALDHPPFWFDVTSPHDPVPGAPTPEQEFDIRGDEPADSADRWLRALRSAFAGRTGPDPATAAAAEAVPGRPTRPVEREALLVHNRASWIEDHTTYWRNSEQFVRLVIGLVFAAAGTPLSGFASADALEWYRSAFERRRWRVTLLGWFNCIMLLSATLLRAPPRSRGPRRTPVDVVHEVPQMG